MGQTEMSIKMNNQVDEMVCRSKVRIFPHLITPEQPIEEADEHGLLIPFQIETEVACHPYNGEITTPEHKIVSKSPDHPLKNRKGRSKTKG